MSKNRGFEVYQQRIYRGGRAGSGPSLGDGLTPSLTVLLCDNGRYMYYGDTVKHVKHGTQNIQNDCHQWLSDSFRVH